MTVKELMQQLSKYNQNAKAYLEHGYGSPKVLNERSVFKAQDGSVIIEGGC